MRPCRSWSLLLLQAKLTTDNTEKARTNANDLFFDPCLFREIRGRFVSGLRMGHWWVQKRVVGFSC